MRSTTNLKNLLAISIILLAFGCTVATGDVIHVDADAAAGGDGTSWATAYKYLQDALARVVVPDLNEIWVAEGIYKPDVNSTNPTGTSDPCATFQLINSVAIYGGFVGTETSRSQRDWQNNVTTLSGDINTPGSSDNSYHVVTGSGTDSTAILDGFTITAGNANADSYPDYHGGGMLNISGSPTVTNCTFSGNSADEDGGGMYNDQSSPELTNCAFSGNSADDEGGGMHNWHNSSPTLTDCNFSGNYANEDGGGMYNRYNSSPTLTDCNFSDNDANEDGGGMFNDDYSDPNLTNCTFSENSATWGGGMLNVGVSPTVTNCTFSGNSAVGGGGMCNRDYSKPTLTDCNFSGNSTGSYGGGMYNDDYSDPNLTNCIFSGNLTDGDGGGMCNWDNSSPALTDCNFSGNNANGNGGGVYNYDSEPNLTNCTFSGNDATCNGGGMYNNDSDPNLTNCTFSENSAGDGGGMCNGGSSLTLTNCTFNENSAAYDGGGMFNWDNSSPTLTNCTFSGNSAADYGGGMYNWDNSSPTLTNCNFGGNDANEDGGGMYNVNNSSPTLTNCNFSGNSADYGGGMYNYDSTDPNITNCTFSGNSADYGGGGMYNNCGDPTITNCIFSGNSADYGGGMCNDGSDPPITNCIFSGNSADYGGGMKNDDSSKPTLTNCTFSENSAEDYGGGMYNDQGSPNLTNCILWGNEPDQIKGIATVVTHSCIQGGFGGIGNIDSDPLFVDADGPDNKVGTEDDNLRLSADSNCIDAGDNTAVPPDTADLDNDGDTFEQTPLDLDSHSRFVDRTDIIDTGNGTPPVVDMGAYEHGRIIFVDINVLPGHHDGTRWANAYEYLQDGLADTNLVAGSEVWVAEGTYKPTDMAIQSGLEHCGNGFCEPWYGENSYTCPEDCGYNRLATFQLINGVGIYGGFAGYETSRSQRNWQNNETILSGDLAGDDSPVTNAEDVANDPNRSENSYHVVTGSGTDSTAVLDGFTILGGNANRGSEEDTRGGGIYNYSGTPTIRNCVFRENQCSMYGGAVYNCSNISFTNCIFTLNYTPESGGGMFNQYGSPTMIDSVFSGNSAKHGGGMYNNSSEPTITNCAFSENWAEWDGGGMYNAIESGPKLTNCTFSGNSADGSGGGVCNYDSSEPTITNCTFSENSADWGGGMGNYYSDLTITNCILWGNSAVTGPQIYNDTSSATVTYSNVQGGYAGIGNIDADPCFVDTGNLRLSPDSPCIEAGSNTALPADVTDLDNDGNTTEPIPYDLDGRKRIAKGDCSIGRGIVDMGAYEFAWSYLGDFDNDCDVDFFDFAIIANAWLAEEGRTNYDSICDISLPADRKIGMFDLKVFCENWLVGKGP